MWPNKHDYIQLIIIAVVFGSAILQFIYRTFFKSVPRGPAGGGPAHGKRAPQPAKSFRDFLEEVRKEARRAQETGGEAERRASEPEPEAMEPWEPGSPPEPIRRQSGPQEEPPVPAGHPVKPEERADIAAESVHEYLEDLARGTGGLTALESGIAEASVGEDLKPLTALIGGPEIGAAAAPRRATRALPLPALGIGLREAVLAQVLLGPPRSKSRRPPSRR